MCLYVIGFEGKYFYFSSEGIWIEDVFLPSNEYLHLVPKNLGCNLFTIRTVYVSTEKSIEKKSDNSNIFTFQRSLNQGRILQKSTEAFSG